MYVCACVCVCVCQSQLAVAGYEGYVAEGLDLGPTFDPMEGTNHRYVYAGMSEHTHSHTYIHTHVHRLRMDRVPAVVARRRREGRSMDARQKGRVSDCVCVCVTHTVPEADWQIMPTLDFYGFEHDDAISGFVAEWDGQPFNR